jgi:hypothetical protein
MDSYQAIYDATIKSLQDYERPSVMMKPRIFIDGNQWCMLYGENLQDGVAGFGDSPRMAAYDFDKAWYAALPKEQPK